MVRWRHEPTTPEGRGGSLGKKNLEGAKRLVGEMMVKLPETHLEFRMDHKPTPGWNTE